MWRKLTIIVGLAVAAVGIFVIAHEQTRNAACNTYSNQIVNSRISNDCLNIAAYYFTGFLMLIIGLVIALFGLLMARRNKRYQVVRRVEPDLSQRWSYPKRVDDPVVDDTN